MYLTVYTDTFVKENKELFRCLTQKKIAIDEIQRENCLCCCKKNNYMFYVQFWCLL